MSKIFGIGLSRTGTTSLTHALRALGFNIIHYPTEQQVFDPNNIGACDIPVVRFYKQLDQKFPKSKFIYTIRDKESWLTSMEAHFTRRRASGEKSWGLSNRIAVYGQEEFDRDVFSKKYDEHDLDVRNYFKNRPDDLLIMNVCAGDGWEPLTSFLNIVCPPSLNFPHTNKRVMR